MRRLVLDPPSETARSKHKYCSPEKSGGTDRKRKIKHKERAVASTSRVDTAQTECGQLLHEIGGAACGVGEKIPGRV